MAAAAAVFLFWDGFPLRQWYQLQRKLCPPRCDCNAGAVIWGGLLLPAPSVNDFPLCAAAHRKSTQNRRRNPEKRKEITPVLYILSKLLKHLFTFFVHFIPMNLLIFCKQCVNIFP